MVLQKARSPIASLAAKQALWAPAYARVQSIIGITTGVILPFGDPNHEASNFTTFTTRGVEQLVFTWSEARDQFDVPSGFEGPGFIPVIKFNGTDEEADTPDADYWFRDDAGGANGFSIGTWVNIPTSATKRAIFTQRQSGQDEWQYSIEGSNTARLMMFDPSAGVNCSKSIDSALTADTWTFIVCAYDGAGGASAANTIVMYENGISVAATATNNASYAGMENKTAVIRLGFDSAGSFYDGLIAGGPLGPIFTTKELTANDVKALYQTGAPMLGV